MSFTELLRKQSEHLWLWGMYLCKTIIRLIADRERSLSWPYLNFKTRKSGCCHLPFIKWNFSLWEVGLALLISQAHSSFPILANSPYLSPSVSWFLKFQADWEDHRGLFQSRSPLTVTLWTSFFLSTVVGAPGSNVCTGSQGKWSNHERWSVSRMTSPFTPTWETPLRGGPPQSLPEPSSAYPVHFSLNPSPT